MEFTPFPEFKDYKSQRVNFLQPKLDGHLTKIYTATPKIVILTKNDEDITDKVLSINHIRKELKRVPRNSILFAERHSPGVLATSVPTLTNEANEKLMLTVFAAPWWDGVNHFDSHLPTLMAKLKYKGLSTAAVTDIPKGFVDDIGKKALLQLALENKWEGWVLKFAHMQGWYKLKPVKTCDAFVIGTQKSFSTTHYGGLQGVQLAVYNEEGKIHDLGFCGGGFKLEYRQTFETKEDFNKLLDRVCEVKFNCLESRGHLKWPRFKRWRTDKNKEQCTTRQFE